MMIYTREAINKLNKILSLHYDPIMQDWDIEMANDKRVDEFLDFYLQGNFSNEEKKAFMGLIIASYDDFLNDNDLNIDSRWDRIEEILSRESILHKETINYWALNSELTDNVFAITPLIRKIIN